MKLEIRNASHGRTAERDGLILEVQLIQIYTKSPIA